MTNKSPFEIRADILAMAKEYMDKQVDLNVQYWEKMISMQQATVQEAKLAYATYSTEDLMKKAAEMYSFVTKKD